MKNNRTIWNVCCVSVVVMAILTFTPLVTPLGSSSPEFFGIPYTMWMGFSWTVIILLFTYIGTKVHPGFQSDQDT